MVSVTTQIRMLGRSWQRRQGGAAGPGSVNLEAMGLAHGRDVGERERGETKMKVLALATGRICHVLKRLSDEHDKGYVQKFSQNELD